MNLIKQVITKDLKFCDEFEEKWNFQLMISSIEKYLENYISFESI